MVVRAFALNAKTLVVTHEIPFVSCSVTSVLNGPGSWTMELPVSFTSPLGVELFTSENFETNRSLIAIVDGENTIMVGLFEAEDGSIDEESETLTIAGTDAGLGYLQRRLWTAVATTYTDVDQFTIAANIVANATTLGIGTGIVLSYVPASTSGVLRDRTYDAQDRNYLFELFDNLANVENGFEYTMNPSGSLSTGFIPGIVVGYPSLLRKTNKVLALGKNIKRLSYSRDGARYANKVNVGGAVKGDVQLLASATKTEDLETYPYYMKDESRATVIEQSTLQSWADRYLKLYGSTPTLYEVDLNANDEECTPGSFRCGDEIRMIANRGRVSFDTLFRISSWTLSVDSDGSRDLSMSLFKTGSI